MNFRDWIDEEESYEPPQITPEIQQWLQGSSVTTPVYHGTNKKFDNFETQASKRYVLFAAFDVKAHGFFFSEDYSTAKSYGNNIVTAYVNVKNPLVDPRRDKYLAIDRLPRKQEANIAFILRHVLERHPQWGLHGDVGVSTFPVYALAKGLTKPKDSKFKRDEIEPYTWIYNVISKNGLEWDVLDNPEVVASMKRLGYDGTFVSENNDASGRSIFVPDANQIKIVHWTK